MWEGIGFIIWFFVIAVVIVLVIIFIAAVVATGVEKKQQKNWNGIVSKLRAGIQPTITCTVMPQSVNELIRIASLSGYRLISSKMINTNSGIDLGEVGYVVDGMVFLSPPRTNNIIYQVVFQKIT